MRRLTILLAAVGALMLVPASQAFANGSIFVSIVGTGSGEVSSVGGSEAFGGAWEGEPPIECAYDAETEETTGTCSTELVYEEALHPGADLITVSALPATGSEFVEWTLEGEEGAEGPVACSSDEDPDECLFGTEHGSEENAFLKAEFVESAVTEHPLTLNINEGEGTVVSDPAGLECIGAEGESCEAGFEEGAEVTLTASPAAGYRFFRWDNCPTGNFGDRQCTVTMSEAKEVGVKFRKSWNLDLSKTGDGVGTIKNTSNGLTCPISCTETNLFLFEGQEITVFAAAPGKNQFVEFSGGTGAAAVCDGQVECTYTVEADASTEAVINQYPKATLALSKEGGGETRITGAMFCNNACTSISGSFYTGPTPEEVTIGWDLKDGTSSIEWTSAAGTCTGKSEADEGSCTVTMDEAHTLVAKLE